MNAETQGEKIERLITLVEGINRRLDISNGRIAKVEYSIVDLEKADINLRNIVSNNTSGLKDHIAQNEKETKVRLGVYNKWIDRVLVVIITIVGFLALQVLLRSDIVSFIN